MATSIILLSAGLDSTVNLQCALDKGKASVVLTFDYGQRAARREEQSAAAMCKRLGLRHEIIALPWLGRITNTALVKRNRLVPSPDPHRLDDPAEARGTADAVWVPNRNGVFLSVAAAYAEAFGADQVVAGFNVEEAATFPDNSTEFVLAFNKALRFSTRTHVRVKSFTARRRKPSIVKLGMKIDAPLDLVWPCYHGGRRMCGRCESCLRFLRAAADAGCIEWFAEHHPAMPLNKSKRRIR